MRWWLACAGAALAVALLLVAALLIAGPNAVGLWFARAFPPTGAEAFVPLWAPYPPYTPACGPPMFGEDRGRCAGLTSGPMPAIEGDADGLGGAPASFRCCGVAGTPL